MSKSQVIDEQTEDVYEVSTDPHIANYQDLKFPHVVKDDVDWVDVNRAIRAGMLQALTGIARK